MGEGCLLRISVVCSVAGLLALVYFSAAEHEASKIGGISPEDAGLLMKICGTIESKHVSKNGHIFMTIGDDTGSIRAVVFNNTAQRIRGLDCYGLKKGDTVCMTGRIDMYEGELEIIPKSIEYVDRYDA